MTTWTVDSASSPAIASITSPQAITDAGDITLIAAGSYSFRKTIPAAFAVTWSAGVSPFTFTDGAGNAGTYNITFNPPGGYTINGQANAKLEFNYQSITLVLDGTNYLII